MATALELMGVRVEVVGHSQGEMMRPCPTLTYAPVFLNADRPREIALKITVPDSFLSDPNVMVLVVSRGKAGKLEKSHSHFLLRVPVLWDGEVPHTRVKGQDNIDFIFLGRDGSFRDMQVSLSTNKAHFFANIQRVYSGWVVRTRGARIGERRFTFAPSESIHAYPGCDYGQVFEDMAEELVDWAIDSGSSVQLSRVKPASWVSPNLPALENGKGKSWVRAEVFFWNAVTVTGRVRDLGTGEELAVRYHSFTNKAGSLPVLCPGQGIYYRPAPAQPGKFPTVELVRPSSN